MAWSISVLPPTVTSGLGRSSVNGRMRMPSPAPMIIAAVILLTLSPSAWLYGTFVFGNNAIIPCPQSTQRRVRQIAFQSGPHPRQVCQIARLAVAPVKAGEDAHDLGVALGRHHRHLIAEVCLIYGCALGLHHRQIMGGGGLGHV